MQRLDGSEEEKYTKVMIYGRSGTGKTSLGASAEEPLILLNERQGLVHVRQAAERLNVPMPMVVYCDEPEDYKDVYRALRGDRTKDFKIKHKFTDGIEQTLLEFDRWPKTVVVDSLTDVGQMLADQIDHESPPKIGSDGLPVRAKNWWNVMDTRFRGFVRSYRDLPFNVVFLCLAEDKMTGDEDNQVRYFGPSLPMRKFAETVSAAVNVVGYSYRRVRRVAGPNGKIQNRIEYGVQTVAPEYAISKPYRPLRDVEVPDLSYWFRVIQGTAQIREAPSPSVEMDVGADKPEASEPIEAAEIVKEIEQEATETPKPTTAKKKKK